jgi:hypothetical protein
MVLTRKEALSRVQTLAQRLGKSVPRADLVSLSDGHLLDLIRDLTDVVHSRNRESRDRENRSGWRVAGAQSTARWSPR